jgi:GTPase
MNFFDLNDDVKSEIVFDNYFRKIKKLKNDVKDDDDFKNATIYKIYKDINDVVYIGSTCESSKKCMSKFRIKSKSRVNWAYDNFYMMIHSSYVNVKIEII